MERHDRSDGPLGYASCYTHDAIAFGDEIAPLLLVEVLDVQSSCAF
jgi:hypothetical protein